MWFHALGLEQLQLHDHCLNHIERTTRYIQLQIHNVIFCPEQFNSSHQSSYLLCYCLLFLRSIVASGTGSSSELVKNSSNRDIGNVVVSGVKVGVLVVVVSIVCSVGFRKTILNEDSYDTLHYLNTFYHAIAKIFCC